ncbi:uncharacterized protein LOC126986080 isoform X2 [Eriocheir sinensis]|uniref:uncharacterized protein LOC126986080 isoform X2 n=1 Tax=Eriocheir sinensis TaxID=95602 RepID=UPI0021C90101|nr:uncharacterized protein LOC126986080 isoform X2 [Eriocheir sinensis]
MSPAFSASAASTPEAAPQPRQTPTPTASSPPILDVTPEAVQPYPKAPPRPAARGRKKIRACILTEDEEALGQLREKEEKKAAREEKKRRSEEKKREKKREQEARQAAKRRRRSEPVEASSSDEEAADNPALCDDSSEYSDEFAEELEHDAASYPFVQKEPEMPRSCCVPGCKSNYSTADASGFRFPEDEQRRVQWIRAIRREDFKPTTNTVVCAKHFEQHCILTKDSVTRPDGTVITAMRGRPSLTKDACPTIFENQPNDCSEDALSQCDEIAIKKEEEDVCIKEEPIEDLDVITGCGTFVPVLKSKPRSNSDHSEDALSQCDEIGIKEEEEDVCTKEDPIEDFDPVTGYTIFVPTLKSKLRSDRAQRACAEHKRRPRKTDGGVPAPATPEGTEKGLSITSSGGNDLGSHHDSRANTSDVRHGSVSAAVPPAAARPSTHTTVGSGGPFLGVVAPNSLNPPQPSVPCTTIGAHSMPMMMHPTVQGYHHWTHLATTTAALAAPSTATTTTTTTTTTTQPPESGVPPLSSTPPKKLTIQTMEGLNFAESEGFKNIEIDSHHDSVTFRTNVKTKEEFERWKEIYCYRTNTCFNSVFIVPVTGRYKHFKKHFVCRHGVKHANKVTSTGCKVQMEVTIRAVHKNNDDKLLEEFPCYVTIKGQHNHPTDSADLQGQRRLLPSIKNMFLRYFEQGMTTAQAQKHHSMKMELVGDLNGPVNPSISPNYQSIANMRTQWLKKEPGALNNLTMLDAIACYASNHQDVTIKVDATYRRYIVVLVTPFMRRAHQELKEAGEVVFVDATTRVDHLNPGVVPLLCAGAAGAVLLGVLFTSSQDEGTLTKGFGMMKGCLGGSAFYGRGAPLAFVTDDCLPERKALAATWPDAKLFLSTFHTLHKVSRWILNAKHRIKKSHRQELMAFVRALVCADTQSAFNMLWESFQGNPLAQEYPNFTRYLTMLTQRKAEWSLAFRARTTLQGHDGNSFCETTLLFIKEVVLSRCKAFNTALLVVFVVEIFDLYMQQRLLDVALKRRRVKPINAAKVSMDVLSPLGGNKFQVQSDSNPSETFTVDLSLGMCTCLRGENGATCKHQAACAEYGVTVAPLLFELNVQNRQWLAALALGKDKVPEEGIFKSLGAPEQDSLNTKHKEAESNTDAPDSSNSRQECESAEEVSMEIDPPQNNESSVSLKSTLQDAAQSLANTLMEVVKELGNEKTFLALTKLKEHFKAVKSSDQLNSLLLSMSSENVEKGGCGCDRTPCQPSSTSRRKPDVPKGATALCRRQRPAGAVSKMKRPKNLAHSVLSKVAHAKSHGTEH